MEELELASVARIAHVRQKKAIARNQTGRGLITTNNLLVSLVSAWVLYKILISGDISNAFKELAREIHVAA